ncbi:RDD family protein [Streptomyces sp. NPDC051987]|uniref:RDD family protein n=1 Tax=Streptomyces sp. NPDC051987 TaxID=3155808 RepID=UPI0034129B5D
MTAPTPAPGDERPREGYYPDPSIPGYVRYWNGAAWVPGTSRPAPSDGEPLVAPPGSRPAAPAVPAGPAPVAPGASAVEETGPHFFDEDPRPDGASGWQAEGSAWGGDPRAAGSPAGPDGRSPRTDGTPTLPPADQDDVDSGGTFIFRRPTVGPAGTPSAARPPLDDGTLTFRPIRDESAPTPGAGAAGAAGPGGAGAGGSTGAAAGFGAQGPVGAPGASGTAPPGFGAGKAAAARAAAGQTPPGPAPASQAAAQSAVPAVPPQQSAAPRSPMAPATPMAVGAGGGQASWAQQVHQLAGDQPVAPWKPPVEDPFQAAARRQAAARPAGLGRRFAARLVDSLVVGAVTGAVAVPFGTRAADHVQDKIDAAKLSGRTETVWLLDGTTGLYLGIVLGVLLLAGVLYEVLPTARWGRTLGKKLFGLEVRDIEGHEPPAFGAALRRWLVYTVPGLLGIGIVGVAWCLVDRPWHQCWHDKAAHTFVAG